MAKNIDKAQAEPIDLKVVARLVEHIEWYRFLPRVRRSLKSIFSKNEPHPIFDNTPVGMERLTHGSLAILATLIDKPLFSQEIIETVERMREQSGNILDSANLGWLHTHRKYMYQYGYVTTESKEIIKNDRKRSAVETSITDKGRQYYDHYFGDI